MIDRKPLNASLTAVKKAFPKAKPKLGMILGIVDRSDLIKCYLGE